ncbi:MAG: hypothetical protein EXQ75_00930 [Candidatus Planktophila sp.]|jgi:hypothetical protein|nr:hypothetical protein [Candidatus Planktophila sp.]
MQFNFKSSKKITVGAILILAFSNLFLAPSASAAEKGWRYWGYYQAAPGAKTWTAAMTGPTVDVKDGAVEGWSFVFSADDIPSIAPLVKPDFKSICGMEKPDKDTKRVALVIDFGSSAYAPKGEKMKKTIKTCVRTAKESQGIDVLGMVAKVRSNKSGLICGLNGYPAKECGVEISTPASLMK